MKPRSLRRRRASSVCRSSIRPLHLGRLLRGLELCEPRWMLATDVHVISGASGAGTLDAQFLAGNGTLDFAASDVGGDTLSSGALTSIAANHDIAVEATKLIDFSLPANLSLPTGTGNVAFFSTTTTGGGDITFLSVANTLSTAGGRIVFTAGGNLTVENLNTGGGDVALFAGVQGAGNLAAQGIQTSSSGNVTLQATNAAGGTITQTGVASGLAVAATATSTVTVDSLRGTTVQLTSNTGSIDSLGASPIQASSELTLTAATGITVNTRAASLEASNSTSGNISITQAASPAQTLTVIGSGVVNSASTGSVTINNLGASITVSSTGGGVHSNNGVVTLAATDLQIGGSVNSGTARTILNTSLAGGPINLGTNAPGSVGLTQSELNNVTAGVLQIGGPAAGAITISAAINNPASWNTLALVNGAAINEAPAGSLTLPNLRVSSTGPVSLTSVNNVQNLAGDVGGSGNSFSLDNGTNTLTIANAGVDGVLGLTTNNGNVDLTTDNVLVRQVVTPGTGTVILQPFTTTLNITLGNASVAGSTFGITNGGLGWITSGVTQIGATADTGTIAITSAINRTPTSTAPSRSQTLSLVTSNATTNPLVSSTTGAVTQTATLSVANLVVQALGGVQLTNAGNSIDQIAGTVTGGLSQNDNFRLVDAPSGTLIVGTVAGVTGISVAGYNFLELTTTGALTLTDGLTCSIIGLDAGGTVSQDTGAAAAIVTSFLELLGAGPYALTNTNTSTSYIVANVTNSLSYTNAGDLTIPILNYSDGFSGPVSGITTHGGDIALTASAMVAGAALIVNSPIDTKSSANITLSADRMALGAAVNAHSGIVTLEPTTTGRAVDLGTNSNAAHVGLLQTDLNNVTGSILRVGNLTSAGSITVTAPITDVGTGFSTLSLLTSVGSGLSQNASATLTVNKLQAAGASGVTLNENNVVSTLAGASEGAFSFVDATNLTIDNVDSGLGSGFGSGIITQAQPISLTVNVLNDSLTVNQQINTTHSFGGPASGGAQINLSADNMALNNNSPSSVINAGTGGALVLTPFTATNTIAVGGPDAAGQLGIDDNDLTNVTAKVVRIGSSAQIGAITVDGTINTHAGYNALDLIATGTGGAITQTTGSIAVANLALQAFAGIGSGGAIQVVGPINLAFHNSTSNNVQVTSTGALTINSVDGVGTSANSASGGTVTLTASSPMTFAVNTSSSGTISATTTETASETVTPLPPPDDDITVNSGVTVESTGGNVVFTSGDGIVRQSASSVKSDTGAVTLTVGVGDNDADASGTIDLAITKTDNSSTPGSAVPGTSLKYTVVVSNDGATDVSGASVADTFPSDFTGASFTATPTGGATGFTASGTGNISDTVNLPAGSAITYVVTGSIPASATGTLSNTATVTAPAGVVEANTANNTATDTLALTPKADLKVTKTDNSTTPGSAVPGASLTYTIVVSNLGPSNASGASVADTFPSTFTGASFTATQTGGATGFTASGTGNISNTVNLPAGSTITYVVTGTVSAAATGTLSNTATVTAPAVITDTNPANNTATDTLTLTPKADLKVTKTDNSSTPGSAVPGASLTYTIVVSNLGPSNASGASVADTFPSAFTGASFTATQTGGATGFTASGTGNISDTVNLPAGSTITYVVTGTVSAAATGTLSNTATVTAPASVTDTNPANNTASDTLTLTPKADLKVTKTDNSTTPGSAVPGASLTYTIVVSNLGPSNASGASVADTFPSAFTGASFMATQTGGATGFTASGTGSISDTVNLPAGSTITYVVTGTVSAAATGTLSNTATITAPASVTDTNPANNTAADTLTLTPKADLKVTKTDNSTTSGSAVPGTGLTYTIVVSNLGPSDVSGASVADTFPTGFTGASFTATQTGGASGFTASGTGNISDTVNLPVGSTITYVVMGTIRSSATGTLSNTATVTAPASVMETNTANDTATDTLTLAPKADLKVTKTDNSTTSGSAVPGTSLTYTIVVSNLGPSDVTGASVADTFPSAFTGASFTATATGGATGFTASGTGNISNAVNLPAGSTITYVVTGAIPASATGTLTNTATVAAPASIMETNTANNAATDTLMLTPTVNLTIAKTDNSFPGGAVIGGSSLSYLIVIGNTGPSDVNGAKLADALPADFTGETFTATATGGATGFTASGNGSISDTLNLPVGSTVTYTVSGRVSLSASGTLTNTVSVVAPSGVTNVGQTSASDTVNVGPVGYLAGVPGDGTIATFVHNLYRELLGREPETAGQNFWNNFLQQHNSAVGRQDVIADFLNSAEYKTHYITTLYGAFLARIPEADGLQYWTGQLGTPGTNSGGTDESFILSQIVGSNEFYAKAGGTSQDFAQVLYHDLLGRSGNSGEVGSWTAAVDAQPNNRDRIVRQFLSTPEAEHKLLDSFYPAPGGTASNPLPAPGAPVAAGAYDLAVVTGDGWENLYLEGPFDSSPQGNDAFFAELAGGTAWDEVQLQLLATDQFYTNLNRPLT